MKILLCIEDDPVVDQVLYALEWSLDPTQWTEILALHVLAPNPLVSTTVDFHPRRRGEALVEGVCGRLSHFSIPVKRLLSSGDPAQEIVRVADRCEADLVVLGARRGLLKGSVCQKVVCSASTDVLVVREEPSWREAGDRLQSFRALVAVDGSLGSEAGIDAFARKIRVRNASIRVVHVLEAAPALWDMGRGRDDLFFQSMESRAREVLLRAKKMLERRGLAAECEWRRGSVPAQILDAARETGADLIIVGSRGHSALRERVLGSITHRVLRHAPCTVLCARGWAPESSGLSRQWSSKSWEPGVGMA